VTSAMIWIWLFPEATCMTYRLLYFYYYKIKCYHLIIINPIYGFYLYINKVKIDYIDQMLLVLMGAALFGYSF